MEPWIQPPVSRVSQFATTDGGENPDGSVPPTQRCSPPLMVTSRKRTTCNPNIPSPTPAIKLGFALLAPVKKSHRSNLPLLSRREQRYREETL